MVVAGDGGTKLAERWLSGRKRFCGGRRSMGLPGRFWRRSAFCLGFGIGYQNGLKIEEATPGLSLTPCKVTFASSLEYATPVITLS